VQRFEHGDEVEVIHRSFPLGDGYPVGSTISVREATLRRYGLAGARLEASTGQIEAMAEQEGLSPYRVLDNHVGNTRLAHEFLAHASAAGKNRGAWDAIFRAYFGQARPIFGLEDLLGLADEIGLQREKTRRVLTEGRFTQQVQDDPESAQRLGSTGAPHIVVDGRYAGVRTPTPCSASCARSGTKPTPPFSLPTTTRRPAARTAARFPPATPPTPDPHA
jgi:predicted DsbA family dithiol-disulfide isomerase